MKGIAFGSPAYLWLLVVPAALVLIWVARVMQRRVVEAPDRQRVKTFAGGCAYGADDAALLSIRRRIMQGAGLMTIEALSGSSGVEETSERGPIF